MIVAGALSRVAVAVALGRVVAERHQIVVLPAGVPHTQWNEGPDVEVHLAVLVPAPPGHPLNTRELVYTGVTRARRRLSVWGSREALEEAARRPTQRHGRLADRLIELAGRR